MSDNNAHLREFSSSERAALRQTAVELFLKDASIIGCPGVLPRTESEWQKLKNLEVYLASGALPLAPTTAS